MSGSNAKRKASTWRLTGRIFENPYRPESSCYTVINGQKKCHSAGYRTMMHLRRKIASYQTTQGFTRYYYTDELEEYEETKLCHYDWTENGAETPCRAETCKTLPYDFQTYILNHDGSMYNEICEFTFDDEKTGSMEPELPVGTIVVVEPDVKKP